MAMKALISIFSAVELFPEHRWHMGQLSIIRWKERGDRTPLIIFNKPKGFGLVRIFEDLEVIEAVLFLRQLLEFSEASED